MLDFLISVIALIVTLGILVTFHEFGHYWVARLCGVHVLRFSVGFGNPFYSKRGRPPEYVAPPEGAEIKTRTNEPLEGTEFAVAAIPLGGYVKMLDEREGEVPEEDLHKAFNRKPVWVRFAIVAAGPIANFLLAIFLYWFVFLMGIADRNTIVGVIEPTSIAGQAGLSESNHKAAAMDIQTTLIGFAQIGVVLIGFSSVFLTFLMRDAELDAVMRMHRAGPCANGEGQQAAAPGEGWLVRLAQIGAA